MSLSVKAQKIQSKLILDLESTLDLKNGFVYVNHEVSFSSETHSSINIDYDDFEAFSFTFVYVRDIKDSYRVWIENEIYYLSNQEDYDDILLTINNKYRKA